MTNFGLKAPSWFFIPKYWNGFLIPTISDPLWTVWSIMDLRPCSTKQEIQSCIHRTPAHEGTRYRGLMINYELDPSPLAADEEVKDKQSVEAVFRTALVRASAITPVNAERLEQKISWSRSSRTDAGVHAVRLVLCAKLLVFPDDIDEEVTWARTGKENKGLRSEKRLLRLTFWDTLWERPKCSHRCVSLKKPL